MSENPVPERGAKRATVTDVAKLAGVSRQTVSRAMNDMSGISSETKARVLFVAKALKYRPSRFGRGLVLGHRPTLGLVLDDIRNPYYPELAASVIATADTRGWNVVVTESGHDVNPKESLRQLVGQVDGVLGYLRIPAADFDEVFGDLPVVVLESSPEEGHRGVVEIDFEPGLMLAVSYLYAQGKRRVVMIDGGPPDAQTGRGEEYSKVMTKLGLEPIVFFADQSIAGGISAAETVLHEVPDVDAIIGFNDLMAVGIVKGLARQGVDIPGQCAVLGIDGLAIGSISTPELSSLSLDLVEVGRIGVELIAQMHDGSLPASGPRVQRRVSHTLLLRESA